MRFACAKKGSGQLRYVARASDCRSSSERLIRFREVDQVIACAHRGGFVYRVAKRSDCRSAQHRPSLVLVLPGGEPEAFCADEGSGRLRSTQHAPYPGPTPPRGGTSACRANERKVIVARGNRRPRAVDDRATVDESGSARIRVLANDSDPEDDRLTVASVDSRATRGSVAIAADRRSVNYDTSGQFEALAAGASATDTFSYRATDGRRRDRASVTVTVQGANDAPIAVADAGTTSEDAATTIAVLANDSDPDQGAALSVTAVDTTGTTGAVTLNPDGTLRYDPAGRLDALRAGEQRIDRFAYTVSDGLGGTAGGAVTVTVAGAGDPPVVTASPGSGAAVEGGPATPIDAALTVADVDDTELTGARVRVASGFEPGDDVLSFTDTPEITGSFAGGVLTLSGNASVASYEAALRAVEYRHTGDNPAAVKTIELQADDGDGLGPAATRTIDVTPVNDAPTVDASAGAASFTENGGPVTIDPGLAVNDPDSALLSGATVEITSGFDAAEDSLGFSPQGGISGVYNPATGVLTLSGADTVASYQAALRSVTYDNSSNNPSTANRMVAFEVTDVGGLDSGTDTRAVSVAGANDAPVVDTTAAPLAYTENGAATAADPGVTVTDADGGNLQGATVRIASGFEPGDVLSFADTPQITGSYAGGVLTLTGADTVANYQAALRAVQYSHTGDNPATSKSVEFVADDGTTDSAPAIRAIAVTPVNDAPTLDTTNAPLNYPEGAGALAADAGITVTDPDSTQLQGATVQITSSFVAAQDALAFMNQLGITGSYDDTSGTLTLSGTASVASYQAALRAVTYENGSDSPAPPARTLTFLATDTDGAASGPATRDVTLGASNDAATITTTAGALAYTEGDPAIDVDDGLTVSDLDDADLEGAMVRLSAGFDAGDELLFTNQNGITGSFNAGTGELTLTGSSSVANYQAALRSIEYRHTGDNPATVKTVEFRADDGDGLGPASTRNIAVTRVNDGPQITTTGASLAYTENDGSVAIDGGLTVTDPDSTQLAGATVAISANFQPAQDELGFSDQLGITGSYNDTSGVLTLTGAASVADYQTALRSVTYANVSEGPTPPARTISFQATDDQAAASNVATRGIAITGVNDPPTAVDDIAATDEDTTLNVAAPGVLANDTDIDPGDTKTVDRLNGSPTLTGTSVKGATVTINANGSYTYNPGSVFQSLSTGQSDTDSFTYRMTDGGGASSTATVNLTITGVSDAPTANADSFDAIGNTALSVGTARPAGQAGKVLTGSVLANDTDPDTPPASLVAESGTFPTTLGGTIDIEADGNFTYHPDDADVGVTDTFTYRVCDATPCNSGTVANSTGTLSLPIAGQVWYVRNNEPAGGDGTSDTPFDTLAEAETASGAGDSVYVFDGDNTAVDLHTGYVMESNERLIGEHSGISLATHTLHPGTTNAHPTLTATDEDVVVLAPGATVDGVNVDPTGTGGGISGGAGTSNVTITDVNVADGGTAGTQPGLELDDTTGSNAISDLTVSTNGATGIRLDNAGTVNFESAGTISITTAGAKGLDAAGTNLGTGSVFDAITVTGSTAGGVSMATTTGTTTFGDLALTTTSGPAAFSLSNAGSVTVAAAGTANVSATGGPAIDVTGTSGATLPFDAVSSTNSTGDGINLAGLGSGTFSAASGTIAGAAGIAFDLDGGSGAISYPGALNNGAGQTAEITGRSGGTVALSGAIADSSDAGGGISLSGNSGGSTTFSNASKVINTGAANAVVMGTSDGHTLTLSGGGLDVDATSGAGIDASTSGTLIVTGSGNTVTTTTGRALNVTNTDIGTGGINFQSIAANGATNGINLDTTGATAGLTVTGGGNTTQGGDNSGGTIQSTTGHGISLTNTTSPSFRNMHLQNTGDSGVNGTQVSGFNFTDGRITSAGDASDENSITFDDSLTATPNLTGAVTITNNVISQTEAEGIDIQNFAGTISDANMSDNALSDTPDVATPGSAISLLGSGTPTSAANITRATIANNTISDFRAGAGIQVRAGNVNAGGPAGRAGTAGSATDVIAITGNTMNGGNGGIGNQPDRFFTGGAVGIGQGNFNVSSNGTAANRLRNIDCIAIEMQADGPVSFTSTISNNFINANSAVGCAGIAVGTDDPLDMGAGSHSTLIQNNNVMGTDGPGIFPIVRDSGSTMTARVINNTVAAPNTTNAARAGIRVDSGSASGDTTLCLEMSGNTTAGSTNSGTSTTSPGINLRKQGTDAAVNTFGIEGLSPSPTGTPTVENYVNSLNTSTSGTFGVGGTALLSGTSGFTSCVAP